MLMQTVRSNLVIKAQLDTPLDGGTAYAITVSARGSSAPVQVGLALPQYQLGTNALKLVHASGACVDLCGITYLSLRALADDVAKCLDGATEGAN